MQLLPLPLRFGHEQKVCVSNACYGNLNGMGHPSNTRYVLFAQYNHFNQRRRRARASKHTFPRVGAWIDGSLRVTLHDARHTWMGAYNPSSHLAKLPTILIFLVKQHGLDL